jgi:hypothetical protein
MVNAGAIMVSTLLVNEGKTIEDFQTFICVLPMQVVQILICLFTKRKHLLDALTMHLDL